MSIKKYKAFVKIAETGNITKAAKELNGTQSGVTQLINSLEEELKVKLLNRSKAGVVLTSEGEELLPIMKEILSKDDELHTKVSEILGTPKSKTIRIASFTSVAVNWLPEIIKEYREENPNITFELVDLGYNNIEESLKGKGIDFAFVPLPLSGSFKCVPLYKDELLAVLPKNHRLSSLDKLPVSYFQTEPVISLIEKIDLDARTVFKLSNVKPNIISRVEDDLAMLAMVEKGLGICIMPKLMLNGLTKNVTTISLSPDYYREIGIAFPDYENASDEVKAFVTFATKWIEKLN